LLRPLATNALVPAPVVGIGATSKTQDMKRFFGRVHQTIVALCPWIDGYCSRISVYLVKPSAVVRIGLDGMNLSIANVNTTFLVVKQGFLVVGNQSRSRHFFFI
jgi:hypothetical protein